MKRSRTWPHIVMSIDFGFLGMRAGLMYYEISEDMMRPAFVDIHFWNKWRITFEFGRIQRMYR